MGVGVVVVVGCLKKKLVCLFVLLVYVSHCIGIRYNLRSILLSAQYFFSRETGLGAYSPDEGGSTK